MHIAIDTSATYLASAGTATYIRCLINEIRCIVPATKITELACKPFFCRRRKVLRVLDTLYRELVWNHFILPRLARKSGADILHCPAMTAPLRTRLPVVLSVLDVYVLRSPKSFPLWQRTIMGHLLQPSLKSAAAIICISEFIKSEVSFLFPSIPDNIITTTLLGVESIFKPVVDPGMRAAFTTKHAIEKPFILSVSTIEPRKNLKTLLAAFAAIKDAIPHDLFLIGPCGWSSSDIPLAIERLGISRRVRLMGFVERQELPLAYSLASVFVYISFYEGFGLPPLEAMACGCPVIASNVASIPEVVGEAARMVNPLAVQEVSAALLEIIESLSLRASLVEKGLARAKRFSWVKCAETTLGVYRQVVAQHGRFGKERASGLPEASENRH